MHPSKRATMARTSYAGPKSRRVGTLVILHESTNVYVPLLGPKRCTGNPGPIEPNIFSNSQGLLHETLGCADLSYQRAHRFYACGPVRRHGCIQRIQSIAPHEFLEKPVHNFWLIEDLQPNNSPTDCERYSTLLLLPVEGTREFLHGTGVALIDRG